jgi:hypothetical protein
VRAMGVEARTGTPGECFYVGKQQKFLDNYIKQALNSSYLESKARFGVF